MLTQLKERLTDLNTVTAVEIQVEAEGEYVMYWLTLAKKKQLFIVEKSGTAVGSLEQLLAMIPAASAVVLSVAGKGVLHRKVEQAETNLEKLFGYVFPQAKFNDYILQAVPADQGTYVSVMRKSQVEEWLDVFSAHQCLVLSITLGPFAVLNLAKAIGSQDDVFSFGKHTLAQQQFLPAQYNYSVSDSFVDSSLVNKLKEEGIEANKIVAYATAFQSLFHGVKAVEIEEGSVGLSKQSYLDKKMFSALFVGGLVFIFGLLLLNTFAYTLLFNKNKELSAQYNSLEVLTASTQQTIEDFTAKELFLRQTGWLNPSVISYYADRIAGSLPDPIKLTSLAVYPIDESVTRKEKKLTIDGDVIVIQGVSQRPTDINEWMKVLNDFSWIKRSQVQDYVYDHKLGKGVFTLHILVSGELE